MANKIKLGKRPTSFKPTTITFDMPDGSEGQIEITFKYRSRTEFGNLIDTIFRAAGDTPTDTEFSLADIMAKTRDKNADYLSQVIQVWNLDEELNDDALRQLADELPAAAVAIMERYRQAATEGRLGN